MSPSTAHTFALWLALAVAGTHAAEVASASSVSLPGAFASTPSLSSSTGFSMTTILKQSPGNTGYILANSVSDSSDQRCFQVLLIDGDILGISFGEDAGARTAIYRPLTTAVDDGEYHAIAVVVEAARLTVFVDGTQQGSARSLGGTTANTCTSGSTLLGARPPANNYPFAGELYSVKLFDTALSEFEVAQESVLPGATPFVPGTQAAEQDLGTSVSSATAIGTVPIVNTGEAFSMTAVDVTLNAGARGYLFANSVSNNDARCFHWFLDSTTNKMAFFWGEHDGGARQALYLATGIDIDDGSAHTYSFSVSTAGELKIFVDYAQVGSAVTLSPVPQTCPGGTAVVGGRPPTTNGAFDLSGSIGGLTHFNSEKTDLNVAPAVVHTGNIDIGSGGEATLASFAGVTEVTGYVKIQGTSLTNLDALSSLTTIGEYLTVYNNAALTNVNGLSAVTSVGSNVYIGADGVLANLDGLSALTTVGGYLNVRDNAALANVDGLSALTTIGTQLFLFNNDALTNLDGLSALTSIGTYLFLNDNAVLANVNGLSALTTIGTYAYIRTNAALANLDGLSALTTIGEYLYIGFNHALANVNGLSALDTIGGYLRLQFNGILASAGPLDAFFSDRGCTAYAGANSDTGECTAP